MLCVEEISSVFDFAELVDSRFLRARLNRAKRGKSREMAAVQRVYVRDERTKFHDDDGINFYNRHRLLRAFLSKLLFNTRVVCKFVPLIIDRLSLSKTCRINMFC